MSQDQTARQPRGILDLLRDPANRDRIRKILPAAIDLERYLYLCCCEIMKEPKLSRCDPLTVLNSIRLAASRGLFIGGGMDESFLIANEKGYKTGIFYCVLRIGAKGLRRIAFESGVDIIETGYCHEKDKPTLRYGLNKEFSYTPCYEEDKGPFLFYWAMATLSNGKMVFVHMDMAEINRVKLSSPGSDDPKSVWQKHKHRMGEKSVLIKLTKRLKDESGRGILAKVLQIEDLAGGEEQQQLIEEDLSESMEPINFSTQEPQSKPQAIAEMLGGR